MDIKPVGTQEQFIKESDEARIWKRCEEEQEIIAKGGFLYEDSGIDEYLNNLTTKILPPNLKSINFFAKVYAMKDPDINACMYPNGIMYINTGMLANIDNEAQLVTILGHELTHAINRHTLKKFRNAVNMSALFSTLYVTSSALSAYGSPSVDYSGLYMYGLLSSVNGYSREMEEESDVEGFNLLLANNYSIEEAPKVFEIFERDAKEQKEKTRIPYVYMDHPSNRARIKNLSRLCRLNAKVKEDQGRITGESIYNANIKNVLLENAILDIKKTRFISAKRAIDRLLKLEPNNAKGYYYLAEVFSHRNEKGDEQQAVDNYKQALRLDNNLAIAHRDLGMIYYKARQSNLAIQELESYLNLTSGAEDSKYINKYIDDLKKGIQ